MNIILGSSTRIDLATISIFSDNNSYFIFLSVSTYIPILLQLFLYLGLGLFLFPM